MELLSEMDDILCEYSNPYMRFEKEFNAAKRDYEKVNQIPNLVDAVKAKLYTKDAPQVIELFVAFVESSLATRNAYMALKAYRQDRDVSRQDHSVSRQDRDVSPQDHDVSPQDRDVWLECVNSIMKNMMRREKLTEELFMIVYGQYDLGLCVLWHVPLRSPSKNGSQSPFFIQDPQKLIPFYSNTYLWIRWISFTRTQWLL